MFSALTVTSGNDKTGPIAVSTTSRLSCAPGCPLAGEGGCYAEAGYYTRMHWDAVTAGTRGESPDEFIKSVRDLKPSKMFRHNVAGDLWHDSGQIIWPLARRLAKASAHLRAAWTYAHHELTASNRLVLGLMLHDGMVVNVSNESTKAAAAVVKDLGLPAVCVVPRGTPAHFEVDGVKFHQCPATYDRSHVQCASCGGGSPLCARKDRDFVVTFPAHGSRAAAAEQRCG